MPHVEREGQRIAYEIVGEGPPVVLAHSFLCDNRMWEPLMEALDDRFRLIAIEARGHGASGPAAAPFSLWDSALDHLAVLDELGVERVAWLGLSMGGMAGLRASLLAPGRIAALGLLNSDGGAEGLWARGKYAAMAAVAHRVGIDRLLPSIAPLMFGASTRRSQPELVARWTSIWRDADVPSMLQTIEAIAGREDLRPQLGSLALPCLVVLGAEDRALPPGRSEALAAAVPFARLERVALSGHLSAIEAPDAVNALLAAFLEEAWATRPEEEADAEPALPAAAPSAMP